jgi:hypothetical protein
MTYSNSYLLLIPLSHPRSLVLLTALQMLCPFEYFVRLSAYFLQATQIAWLIVLKQSGLKVAVTDS